MTSGVTLGVTVLLSGLVQLPLSAVGLSQATPLLGCPTVQPSPAPRTHEHSGHVVAPMRARVLLAFSLYTRKK